MSGDAFKRAQAGQPLELSARAYNAMLDAAQGLKNKRHDILQPGAEQFRQADIVFVRNDTGYDQSRFAVLGINGVIFTPDDNLREFQTRVAFTGVAPDGSHRGKFLVLLDPLKDGKIGRAWASGVCPAQIELVDPSHRYCDVIDGDTSKLRSCGTGTASILYPGSAGGSGDEWGVIRFGNREGVRLCKTTALWEAGTVATLDVWENGVTPDEEQTTGETIEATNHLWDVDTGTLCLVMFGGAGANYLLNAFPAASSCEGEGS